MPNQGLVRTASAAQGDTAVSNPWNHTIDSTATNGNRLLIVGVFAANNPTTGTNPGISMTYDGNAPDGTIDVGNVTLGSVRDDVYWEFAYWNDANMPASGNATLAISYSTTPDNSAAMVACLLELSEQSLIGADGVETEVSSGTAYGGSITPTGSANSIIHICFDGTTDTWTAATGYTEQQDTQAGTSNPITAYLGTYMNYNSTSTESNSATASSGATRGISWKLRVEEALLAESSGGAALVMGL